MERSPKKAPSVQELIAEKERAVIASRAKSELLAAVSHELRIPLTGIIGMAQLLSIDCLLPGQKEQVDDILKASEHLLSVVNDLLDLTQLEAGKMELHSAPVHLKTLIDELINMLSVQATIKGLELMTNYDQALPIEVKTDARLLRQIFLNLIENAIKYTEKGYVLIKVSSKQKTQRKILIEFRVQDTGIGISEEKRDIIFDRFSQADAAYSRRYGGTGLGLTLSKHLVELMGGTIHVESTLNKGSEFIVTIPCEIQSKENQATHQQGVTKKSWVETRHKNLAKEPVILLVEDDLIVQKVHKMMIEKLGYKVNIASNGWEAVKMAEKHYDLILMDVGLPEMSGLEATKKIRDRENNKRHTPIIAVTAYIHEEDKNNCLAAGMDDVATKPISPEGLKALLDHWLVNTSSG